ncbi:MAG: M56 family metallopeptidase [Planctomycetota bacterium]|nr:M56 family metallopeptidase [Planctomycetota bacterium]
MNDFLAPVASWLAAFLLHSTLWLGGVALLLRLRPDAPATVRDFLWRAALVASLLTPTVQTIASEAFGWHPLGGALRFGATDVEASVLPAPVASLPSIETFVSAVPFAGMESSGAVLPLKLTTLPQPPLVEVTATPQRNAWMPMVLGLWFAAAALGIGCLLRGTLRFRRSLGAREVVGESASARALRKLLERAGKRARGVRLTMSDSLRVPVALGVFRREICVPQRALRDLPPTQQRAMIGHEFAHLLRRDPAWLGAFEVARRLFFFQPLFVLAQRGAHESAEELCDAWSARRTGDPVALVECLVEVARWLEPRGRRHSFPLAAACMARPDSPLARRVEALLAADPDAPERAPRGLRLGACALALSLAAFMPGFSGAPEELSLEARFELVSSALAEVQSDLAQAREEDPYEPRLARLGARLDVLRAQAARLSVLIEQ